VVPSITEFHELWVLLNRGSHIILRARNNELRQYGISSIEAAVLCVMHNMSEKVTPSKVSQNLLREPNSISALLRRMQKKGLVNISRDLDKRNVVRLALTEKGREAYQQSMKLESICRILSTLSEEEITQLRSFMQKLRDTAVKELANQREMPFPLLR